MSSEKTPCCDEPVVVDGAACIAWSPWEKTVKCMRCGTTYGPNGPGELSDPAHLSRVKKSPPAEVVKRISELEEGDAVWVSCRGVLLHEGTDTMWIDPRFTTTSKPEMDDGFPGLCSVLIQRKDGKYVAVEGVKDHTTLVPTNRSNGVMRDLEWAVVG